MKDRRSLLAAALAAVLLLPAAATSAQGDGADASPVPVASMAAVASAMPVASPSALDSRLTELEALVPMSLAGLPLDENLVMAAGEELLGVMSPQEVALLQDLFAAHGVSAADYAAAATWVPLTDSAIVVLQAHRIAGLPAAEAVDAWVRILSLSMTEPRVTEGIVDGRSVTVMTDAANPGAPRMQMFPADDVTWMMWADDQLLVKEAMDKLGADAGAAAEDGSG